MRVLVACEESQRVCTAFREKGHEAYSCDILPCSGGHPEWHIQDDVLKHLNENWDLIIAHPPCFVEGTQVLTIDGMKSIEDVKEGDFVLTHLGRYRRVNDVMKNHTNKIAKVHTENCGYIECTPSHPFYISNVNRKGGKREVGNFEWVSPENFICIKQNDTIKRKTYTTSVSDEIKELPKYNGVLLGVNSYKKILKNSLKIESKNFWYIVGRWLGDGWMYYQYQNGKKRLSGIRICCSKEETNDLKSFIESAGFTYYLSHEKTTDKFEIANTELALYLTQFGEGASNKHIPGFVTRLPDNLAKSFLSGYFDADGSVDKYGTYCFSTVSQNLAYTIKYMVNKYYHVGCSIKYTKNRNRIEGRICKTKPIYVSTFRKDKRKQTRYLNFGNYILAPYRSVEIYDRECVVYNLSVEEDESYTANGVVVHNCTHLSSSGARHFPQKREDGRQRAAIEFFCQFLTVDCPKVVIENPIGIIGGEYVKKYFPDLCEKYGLPIKPTQIIQPYQFGHPYTKQTCLWIKGLPELKPTEILEKPETGWVNQCFTPSGRYGGFSSNYTGSSERSKTFLGIAKAMADQWG